MKSILKIIIHVLKLLQKNSECLTSKPNTHVTFELYIKISSNRVQHKVGSRDEMRWSSNIIILWVAKGAGRPRLTYHHKGGWNETKWMRWVWRNGGIKFVVGENGRNPVENLPRTRFVQHETHVEGPRRELGTPAMGGERLTAYATRPPLELYILKLIFKIYIWETNRSI